MRALKTSQFFTITTLLFAVAIEIIAQTPQGPKKENRFFSKLYFPFDVGITAPVNQKNIRRSFCSSTGIEYRLNREKALFIRGSWDANTANYQIHENSTTNTSKASLKFTSLLAGPGYRLTSKKSKFRSYGLLQAGINFLEYPFVKTQNTSYEVDYRNRTSFAFKAAIGFEFYPLKDENRDNFAFSIEPFYTQLTSKNVFLEQSGKSLGVKLGITTVLF